MLKRIWIMGLMAALLALLACDNQRISELEEGMSSEADVRARFGEPEKIWDAPNGGRTFEYNRQPAGHVNYMITIGTDGKMSALRQVLNKENFAKVQPGMMMEDVRKMLGKPMKVTPFEQLRDLHWLAEHFAHVFHHHAGLHLGKILLVQHLAQGAHLAVCAEGDHVVLVPGGLAVVLKRAPAIGCVPDFFGLAKARTHVGLRRHALFKFDDALVVASHQRQQC